MKHLFGGTLRTEIVQSSIHHCRSKCVLIDQVKNIKLNNNVIASAANNHIELLTKDNLKVTITYNLMIDAHNSAFARKVSCFSWRQTVYTTTNEATISNNLCSGSTGRGFNIHYEKCNKKKYSVYKDNTAGSSPIGFEL